MFFEVLAADNGFSGTGLEEVGAHSMVVGRLSTYVHTNFGW